MVTLRLKSLYEDTSECEVNAYILPKLTAKLPPFRMNKQIWPHVAGLQLADPDFSTPGHIDIIIGADNYGTIILPGLQLGEGSSPIAQRTIFGWVLSGPVSAETSHSVQAHHCTADRNLQDLLARFWTQEEFPTSVTSIRTEDEEKCEQHFLSTHTRDTTGRYVVRLPLKSDPSVLGESKQRALGCLQGLFQRFSRNPAFHQLYADFINEYKRLGHMKLVTSEKEQATMAYYLPHHGVLREHSSTTKLRVVFNGSSLTTQGLSLNDILHAGAKLQTDIIDILLWIRTHQFLFSTDIEKMFRQIAIHPDDWDLQRILWKGLDGQPEIYQLTTLTYGLNCAPFLALRTLQQLTEDEGSRFPHAITPLTKGRYVDDIFGGAESISEAKVITEQLSNICKAGGFPLQKWNSNCPEILPYINEHSHLTVEIEPTLHKILGLIWRPDSDTFHFSVSTTTDTTLTKRKIASAIAKLYDPLGLISPILVCAKIILQQLWLTKSGWDDPTSSDLQDQWTLFRQQLSELEQVTIPRWLKGVRSTSQIELHGFSDASQLAMAAAVYARIPQDDGTFSVQLVCSKTKIAPIKRSTIPRLELVAALLLARLIKTTVRALQLPESSLYCWSDSSVALTWINAHPARWKDFVHNRVLAIQEIIPNGSWHFVSGKENPADCASRGLRPDQLINHPLWWQGPSWLKEAKAFWPSENCRPESGINLEERPGQVMVATAPAHSYWNLLDKYSSLTKLLRVTATCRRVAARLQKLPQSSPVHYPLTPTEITQSRDIWVRLVQREWFSNEIRYITKGNPLPKSNPLVRLTPFLDSEGLLRVGGRLHNAALDPEAKHPLILPRRSPLTILIVDDAHRRTLHGGTQVTLNCIRNQFWIIGGRAPVRSRILKCVRCARYRGTRAQQLMGQLPSVRVTPARPFQNSGLDYAGPITLKTWKGRAARTYKGYLAIFICLATSAIHIEVVTDYTTAAFIAAFKRFTGRRGICNTLQSDCGTNFLGADAELRRQFDSSSTELKELASLLATDGTEWKFNPPSSPHFGGLWEAAVKSTKYHLKRVLREAVLTYEEMTTVTIQIEAVLNSRPLCPLSEDVNDYSALTPGHFLIGEPPAIIPEPNLATEITSRLSRWQLLKQKLDQFWNRWSSECLQRYQAISKWHHPSHEIKEGSLVLMVDERYPPGKWPLARITQLHPGADGLIRVVSLQTASSSYKRPIAK
ncbi:PREDICTED: uncharacterized protein LOC105571257, partial [Vollenhovia emeryi]|uniref:uncharacterized protein LOC105571257 n=1 Tax=Vollenhovia emeryi TaxID=411798 RepID=UPI0005F37566